MVTAQERRHSLKAVRRLTILAQDPAVRVDGALVRARIEIPTEELLPGPTGYRVSVIDYDATANMLYAPLDLASALVEEDDPFLFASDDELIGNPGFHAQNAYAIAMRILARFEFALGRRIPWGSAGHQLHIAPHAFADANAFYSREDRGLFFGYFTAAAEDGGRETVYTCLSHDIVAHETTHAVLDGLRAGFMEPSLPDQAAFHEGFADVVALLSVFSLPETIGRLLAGRSDTNLIDPEWLTEDALKESALFGLAKQMGSALTGLRGQALRRSITLEKGRDYLGDPEFQEEHSRGELIVAAMLGAFLSIWIERLSRIGPVHDGKKDLRIVVEEGARAADHLLTMAIRAIDYCPPVDLSFGDYLSALLTVDREVVPDDRHGYRAALLENFRAYGIRPSGDASDDGTWLRCDRRFVHSQTHFDSMLRDREEVFRFIWENRVPLDIGRVGYIEVQSVRPSFRIAPDGFMLRETIVEYVQRLTATAGELSADYQIPVPSDIPHWKAITILAGGTIIFDEYGQVKYQIAHHLTRTAAERDWQARRIRHLWDRGLLDVAEEARGRFAAMHATRAMMRSAHESPVELKEKGLSRA
ncbi:hypothetical protein SAMN05428974_0530 [Sphingopyxis sp. YR583]|uniref:hypothetical protein n=1 Tax=Sphingopyxis sp. YR583 TaxID=1881047 RepID=UPI0008A8020F|nr:hypothetical protein [Sphingopyxis sp. YR583]SEH12656.1 hypothetical protein SAMN05428974_0530 [Sphingopyxis sp. YR583]